MSKRDKYAKQAVALSKSPTGGKKPPSNIPKPRETNFLQLKIGDHSFPIFDGRSDAYPHHYPEYSDIPEEFKRDSNKWHERASNWFFKGGRMSDWNLEYNTPAGVDKDDYWKSVKVALQLMLESFHVDHHRKIATVAWCMSEWLKEN